MLASDATLGTEFWIAIPPNEILPFPVDELEIYVASAYETEITVYDPSAARTYKRKLAPYEIRTLADKRGETNWSWEVRDAEQPVMKGIRITSPKPISVYVLNSKVTSSDGYLAIPVSAWGTEYIATTYFDFREFKPWAGGFIVVGSEDDTEVTIQLRGSGALDAKTSGGRSLNDAPFTVTLNAGEVYMVKGDGVTRGVFDLTGSKITSNKPVGLISFHERTTMPNLLINGHGRNHLAEMTPPTTMWGKRYVTVELQRENSNGQGKGDVFRVIARDSNTQWTMKYYDKETKELIGQGGGRLSNPGEFADITQAGAPTTITHGYSVWEADKPIFVMQYSCSSSWDGDTYLDPFMFNVTSEEQFITGSVFQFPTSGKFSKHRLNLIVKTDTSSPDLEKNLESLEIDGIPVWNHPAVKGPALKLNGMPDGLYWTTLDFGTESTAHRITSNGNVRFGGYIYGYGAVDAYGWPLAATIADLRFVDTMPPFIIKSVSCGDYTCQATELRNNPTPLRPEPLPTDQVETGIARIDTVPGASSSNYRLELITDNSFPRRPAHTSFSYAWKVVDKSKSARAIYAVQDWRGNVTLDTCVYTPSQISSDVTRMEFGRTRLGSPVSKNTTFTNTSTTPLTISKVELLSGGRYAITDGAITMPRVLQAGDKLVITITYDAAVETASAMLLADIDTLIVSTSACGDTRLALRGVTVEPQIEIEDFDAGTVDPGSKTCKSGGLRITNSGSDTVTITRITGYETSNFTIASEALAALPIRIAPKATYQMIGVCYLRNDVGGDSIRVDFESDAKGPKTYSLWRGSTSTTSVDDESTLSSFIATSTADGVRVTWTVADVASVRVTAIRGEELASVSVASDTRRVVLQTKSVAQQAAIVTLIDSRGAVVGQRKVIHAG